VDTTDLEGAVLAERFRLDEHIAQGGYGAVFRAVQLSVDRPCAVKILPPELCADDSTEQRFRIEARMTSRLTHPNTVVLYDFGRDEERSLLFLAMELLDGRSVEELVEAEGPLPVSEVARIVEQAAGSLREAHEAGAVHRDVKPHNLMLVDRGSASRFVKVIDFGIAKALRADTTLKQSLTKTGMMIGSPAYMAPEQIRATEMDGRTDEYGLGMTTYFMLTGETPFGGGTSMEVASRHLTEEPPAPSDMRPGLDVEPAVEQVVMRSVGKSRDDRFDDVEAYAEALVDAVERGGGATAARSSDAPAPSTERPDETSEGFDDGTSDREEGPEPVDDETGTRAVPQTDWAEQAGGELDGGGGGDSVAVTAEIPDDDPPVTADRVRRPDPSDDGVSVTRRGLLAVAGVAGLLLGAAIIFAVRFGGEGKTSSQGEGLVGERADVGAAANRGASTGRGDASRAVSAGARRSDVASEHREGSSGRVREESEVEESAPGTEGEASGRSETDVREADRDEEPAAGRVEVRMIPWGTLLVDGRPVGNGSTVEARVPVGRHRLEMQQDGEVVDEETVRVERQRRTAVELVSP
jgi:serine/threonine protein kinase